MGFRKKKKNQSDGIQVHTAGFENSTRLLWVYHRHLREQDLRMGGGVSLPGPDAWGTGFFVVKKVGQFIRTIPKIFLVTNEHVLENAKQVWFKPTVEEGTPEVAEVVIFVEGKIRVAEGLDLAVVDVTERILDLQRKFPNIRIDPIPYDVLPTGAGQLSILEGGTPLAFLGYIDARNDIDNTPARGVGELSKNSKKQPEFLVSTTPSITPGASGSPTFATIGSQSKLIGVATEVEFQNIEDPKVRFTTTTYGHVLKATALKNLIDSLC